MAKFLIIEDDDELATTVAACLRGELHQVAVTTSGVEGLEKALAEKFDAIILDLGLPDLDGLSICKQLREEGNTVPILILTGKNQINDRIIGLDLGADDYMTKPFSARELSARLRAMLRRPKALLENVLGIGNISVDLTSRRVLKNGAVVTLSPIDFALLEFLLRNPRRVFSSEELLDSVWASDKPPSDNAVRSAVKRLRQALDDEDDDEGGSVIETVSKSGYRLKQS